MTQDKSKLYVGSQDLVRQPWGRFSGKIIHKKGGRIYEGGLNSKGSPEGLGFTFINGEHKMLVSNQYLNGKMHGRQVFDYLYWGFRTEEYYAEGKPCGIWRYKTVHGYEYVYDVGNGRQLVRFPFLTKDYYKGDVEIWCDNIKLTNGVYYIYPRNGEKEPKAVRVLNCEDFLKMKDVRKNFFVFEEAIKVIQHKTKQERQILTRLSSDLFVLDPTCYFRGHIKDGMIVCPQENLRECLFSRKGSKFFDNVQANLLNETRGRLPLNESVDHDPKQAFSYVNPGSSFWTNICSFSGNWVEGHPVGFCKMVFKDQSFYSGFVQKGQKEGEGLKIEAGGSVVYKGRFQGNQKEGPGMQLDFQKKEIAKGVFSKNSLNGLGILKNMNNSLQYFGNLQDGKRQGRGSLKFQNLYTFEGDFAEDRIAVESKGKLIHDEEETVEDCEVHPTPNQDLSIVTTKNGHFILDLKKGIVLRTDNA